MELFANGALCLLLRPGAQPEGAFGPPEILKTLHSNYDILRNFPIIKVKFSILIIFKKSFTVLKYYFALLAGAVLSRCNRCSCIGPRASGAPRHGVWVDC